VAKHGNRAVTSRCGAADVLEALGVPIDLSPGAGRRVPARDRLHVPLRAALSPGHEGRGPLRRALGFRTIFNLCGPLTNPAGARNQVIGVLAPSRVLLVGRTLAAGEQSAPLSSTGPMASTSSPPPASPSWPRRGVRRRPADAEGRARHAGDGRPAPRHARPVHRRRCRTNAALLYDVITGIPGPRRDIVLLNAAAALVAAGLAFDLKEGVAMGAEAIDSGQAAATLAKLRQFGEKHMAHRRTLMPQDPWEERFAVWDALGSPDEDELERDHTPPA
jgi:anthranilate phosphoribosyltransferase